MQTSNNFSSDVSIDKSLRKLKMFSEDIELSVTSDKADERERSVRNVVNVRQCELGRGKDWNEAVLLDQL
jgi:hypothetical protein